MLWLRQAIPALMDEARRVDLLAQFAKVGSADRHRRRRRPDDDAPPARDPFAPSYRGARQCCSHLLISAL
jgi:hypothetical protein